MKENNVCALSNNQMSILVNSSIKALELLNFLICVYLRNDAVTIFRIWRIPSQNALENVRYQRQRMVN